MAILELLLPEVDRVKIISTQDELTTIKSKIFQFDLKYVCQKAINLQIISNVKTHVKK